MVPSQLPLLGLWHFHRWCCGLTERRAARILTVADRYLRECQCVVALKNFSDKLAASIQTVFVFCFSSVAVALFTLPCFAIISAPELDAAWGGGADTHPSRGSLGCSSWGGAGALILARSCGTGRAQVLQAISFIWLATWGRQSTEYV